MKKTLTQLRYFLLLVFIPAGNFIYSQQSVIDSLENAFVETTDTLKVRIALDLEKAYETVNIDKAIEYALLAKYESIDLGYQYGEAMALRRLASAYYYKGEMPKAEQMARQAIPKLRESATETDVADATNLLGLICMDQAKYDQAEICYRNALNIYINTGDTVGVVIATHNIGVVSFYRSQFDKTALYYNQSLRLAEQLKNRKYISTNLLNLGLLYSNQDDFQKARFYINKALANYQADNNQSGIASCIKSLGTIYFNEGNMDSAFVFHQKALDMYYELGSEYGIGQQLGYLGDVYVQKEEFDKAEKSYRESIRLRRKNDDRYGLALSYTGMANTFYATGKMEMAALYYDSALVISKEIESPWRTAEIYMFIADFQETKGNYKKAYEALKNYTTVRDTIFNAEKTGLVHDLEAQYESEKAQKDILVHKKEISLLEKANRRFVYLIIAVGVIAILIVLLLMGRSKRLKLQAEREKVLADAKQKTMEVELGKAQLEQDKIRAELDYKRKELTQLALHINQQNEFLESLKNNLREAEENQQIKSLERELEAKLNIDKQRESFEMNIDLIHNDFYKKLNERFSDLTENEKKLCAMLRLGLSSKEIASVQNISPKSVDMSRYRLRKKLNLINDEDIVKFLLEL